MPAKKKGNKILFVDFPAEISKGRTVTAYLGSMIMIMVRDYVSDNILAFKRYRRHTIIQIEESWPDRFKKDNK